MHLASCNIPTFVKPGSTRHFKLVTPQVSCPGSAEITLLENISLT